MDLAKRMIEILKAENDPVYFAESDYFWGLNLWQKQLKTLNDFYEGNYKELVATWGYKSGKTVLAGTFAGYEAFKLLLIPEPAKHFGFVPNTKIFIMVVAVSEEQGRDTIFDAIVSGINRSPFFREMRPKIYKNEIRFPAKNIVIMVGTSSSSSLVGRLSKIVIWDELARFEESTSPKRVWNLYYSLKSTTKPFGNKGYSIIITTPIHQNDIAMTRLRQAQNEPTTLALNYPTWECNPNITMADLKDEMERDPLRFWCDYGAKPLGSMTTYVPNPDIIPYDDGLVNTLKSLANKVEPVFSKHTYILAGDPALKHDAFGIALGYIDPLNNLVIDGMHRFKPDAETEREVSPLEVKKFICDVIRKARVQEVVFDTWNFPELQEEIRMMGVNVANHIVKKEDYDRWKERCFRKTITHVHHPVFEQEVTNLRIVNYRKVDHLPGGSKDVADCVANIVWCAAEQVPQRSFPLNVVTTF